MSMHATPSIPGKHAVITGAAQGIGAAIAERLASEGATSLTLVDLNVTGMAGQIARLREQHPGLDCRSVAVDLIDIEAAMAALDDALADRPAVDVLANCAGITSRGGLDDIDPATFDRLFAINVRAPLFVTQALRPRLAAGGTIINITSMLAYGGPPFLLGYSASKAALVAMTRGIANTMKWDGIRVFGINLGWTLTPAEQQVQTGVHGLDDDWAESIGRQQPFGRLLMPEDPAALAAFLCSDDARMMTGAIIDLDQYVAGTVDDNPGAAAAVT